MFLKKHTIHIFNGHPSCLRDNGLCCKNVFLTHKFDSYKKCAIIIFDFNLFSVRFLGINRRTNLSTVICLITFSSFSMYLHSF